MSKCYSLTHLSPFHCHFFPQINSLFFHAQQKMQNFVGLRIESQSSTSLRGCMISWVRSRVCPLSEISPIVARLMVVSPWRKNNPCHFSIYYMLRNATNPTWRKRQIFFCQIVKRRQILERSKISWRWWLWYFYSIFLNVFWSTQGDKHT